MNWTEDKPTCPGYYWYRNAQGVPEIVRVQRGENGHLFFTILYTGPYDALEYAEGLWSTPIDAPADMFSFGEEVYVPVAETWQEGLYVEYKEGLHHVLLV